MEIQKTRPRRRSGRSKKPVRPLPAPSGSKRIDRRVYAEARARGMSRADACRLAGSRAKGISALSELGGRLECEEGYVEMLNAARDRVVASLDDHWDVAVMRARQVLDDPKLKHMWKDAWRLFAAVGGRFATRRHEVTVTGEVKHEHEHRVTIGPGWLREFQQKAEEVGLARMVEGEASPALPESTGVAPGDTQSISQASSNGHAKE